MIALLAFSGDGGKGGGIFGNGGGSSSGGGGGGGGGAPPVYVLAGALGGLALLIDGKGGWVAGGKGGCGVGLVFRLELSWLSGEPLLVV